MIIGLIIYESVAVLLLVIGLIQFNSKKPVGFYSGEKPPEAEKIGNVKKWNRMHGGLWFSYAAIFGITGAIGLIGSEKNLIWALLWVYGGGIIPLPIMAMLHTKWRAQAENGGIR